MEISELINEELIIVNAKVTSQKEIFEMLFKKLLNNGYVRKSFLVGIMNREKVFPTGLFLGSNNIAIPHTDAEHVIKPAIALATLEKPVIFKNMANPIEDLPVNIVFMLALNSPHAQVNMLQQLVSLFQNNTFLQKILEAEGGDEIVRVIKDCLKMKK
ncbi:putative PTS IIA-like nitrogen-regulatory protein PtsN [Tepidanaerobacter acetatoxydans Re1]|uniref:Putative PTS IIA-like nitrogen-regulatory protein PtsN n=1 Tax=Tepidanaerobacter acetatoxydans (strain DSM 21804 / JCM 16047 / Re1) TaxID=1209989 RepID=F4LVV7_TEPAE|nr:PTS sugar transporter subunit IIA [Tepidanaerobacter acetatoxydans]AEE90804.1 putative PTS IIA-like nitrogen-regulatory protein PtsN [Tepidanaerobacter acetatoxydans Re1]CCP25361.1 putative PTS IIA-like nitrogen-regulatory protein PtsN [Tepidanaerobacter acetatoxydans Re1]